MSALTDFLLARIAEDEAVAKMPPPGPWGHVGEPRETSVYSEPTGITVAYAWRRDAQHIARHDPARVLAECEAKRGLISDAIDVPTISMRRALKWLALPYADHPDYAEATR